MDMGSLNTFLASRYALNFVSRGSPRVTVGGKGFSFLVLGSSSCLGSAATFRPAPASSGSLLTPRGPQLSLATFSLRWFCSGMPPARHLGNASMAAPAAAWVAQRLWGSQPQRWGCPPCWAQGPSSGLYDAYQPVPHYSIPY